MPTWKKFKLADVINVKHGYAFKGEYFSDEPTSDILLTPGNFSIGGGFKDDKFKYYKGEVPEDYVLKKDDVVVTMTDLSKNGDTLGYSALVPEIKDKRLLHNQRIGLLQYKTGDFDSKYLYWLLRTKEYQNFVVSSATGTTVRHTSPTRIQEYEFEGPDDTATQTRIASILSALDDKIELNRQMNQTLEQMAQALFKKYFVDDIDADNLPVGWRWGKLGEIVNITSSKRIFLEEYVPSGIPFYRGKEIIQLNKGEAISTELFISEEKFSSIKSKFGIPKRGDILITSVGTIGVPYLIPDGEEFYFKDGNLTWINEYFQYFSPYFLYQWLISEVGQGSIENITIGSTQKAITIQSLKNIALLLPDEKTHNELSVQLEGIRKSISNYVKENILLSSIRDTLLPKLMSGEIEVNAEIENEIFS